MARQQLGVTGEGDLEPYSLNLSRLRKLKLALLQTD
jgi:hypothetical protein